MGSIEDGKKVRFVWYANDTVEVQVEGQLSEFCSFQDLDEEIQASLCRDYRWRQHQNDPDFYEED
jgi:hypothetical protein